MACENPLRMPNPRYKDDQDREFWYLYYRENFGLDHLPDEYIDVPCGKCFSCRKQYQNGWRMRLLAEYKKHPNSVFITLTFDDNNLKRFTYAPNRAVRLFLDRARKALGKQVRHFIIGEYGSKTGRFHYHGILFNVDLDNMILSKLWKYGFVYIGYCNDKTISYIIKYLVKDSVSPGAKKVPRLIVSKGIGSNLADELKNEPIKRDCKPYLTYNNSAKVMLPRYIRDKLFTLDELCYMKFLLDISPFKKFLNGKEYSDPVRYKKDLKKYFEKQILLGFSPKPVKKIRSNTAIKPLTLDQVRFLDPSDTLDFYSPNEVRRLESFFEIDNIPF